MRGRWLDSAQSSPRLHLVSQARPRPRSPGVSSSSRRLQGVQRPAPWFPRRLATQIPEREGLQLSGLQAGLRWGPRITLLEPSATRESRLGVPPGRSQGRVHSEHSVSARAAREGHEVNVSAPPRGDGSLYPFAGPNCPQTRPPGVPGD